MSSGQSRRPRAQLRKSAVFLVDGEEVQYDRKTSPFSAIPASAFAVPESAVTVVSDSETWRDISECVRTDHMLTLVLNELTNNVNVRFGVDEAITETLTELAPSEPALRELAQAVARRVLTDQLLYDISTMYKRFMVWWSAVGGVPVGYVSRGSAGEGPPRPEEVFTKDEAQRDCARVSAEFDTYARQFRASAFARCMRKLDRTCAGPQNNAAAREIADTMEAVSRTLPRRVADRAAFATLETLKTFRHSKQLYIPQAEAVGVYYLHENRAMWVVDPWRCAYRCTWVDPPRFHFRDNKIHRITFHSVVQNGLADSARFTEMKDKFFAASATNCRRAVVTAPGSSANDRALDLKQSERFKAYLGYIASRYPQIVYDDLLAKNYRSHEDESIANIILANANMDAEGDPHEESSYEPRNKLYDQERTFNEKVRVEVLDDLRKLMSDYQTHSESYVKLSNFVSAVTDGRYAEAALLSSALPEFERRRAADLLATFEHTAADFTRPDVHHVSEDSKLLATYTATVGLPEIEELFHLWSVMWEANFTGENLFSRRKNTVSYKNKTRAVLNPPQRVNNMFRLLVNNSGQILPSAPPPSLSLTLADTASLLSHSLNMQTTGMRNLFASLLGITPSSVEFNAPALAAGTRGPPGPLPARP